jgi:uncharacterized protein YkwD
MFAVQFHGVDTKPIRIADNPDVIRTARVIIGGMTLVFVLAVAGAGAFSAAATKRAAACRNDGSAMAHLSATQVRTAVVCLINQERTRFGLPPVTENAQLDHAAQGHVTDMVKRDYFAHNAPGANGSTPQQRITAAGYTWGAWG